MKGAIPIDDKNNVVAVRHGDLIRLQSVEKGDRLHSHKMFPAPITKSHQEITGYRPYVSVDKYDKNDIWQVELVTATGGLGRVTQGSHVRLIHVETDVALHSHDVGFDLRGWKDDREVTGNPDRDDNDIWIVNF